MASITLSRAQVRWIKEWVKHQELMAKVRNLGAPQFELPVGPTPCDLPMAVCVGSLDDGSLSLLARDQVERQLRQIDAQIEELQSVKEQVEAYHKTL